MEHGFLRAVSKTSSGQSLRKVDTAAFDSFNSCGYLYSPIGVTMPIFGLHPAGLLETVFEETGIAVAVIDQQENFVFANRTAIDLFGQTAGSTLRFRDWRNQYRLEDLEGHEINLEDSVVMRALHGERVEAVGTRATFPNGATKWLRMWAYPFSAMGMSGVLALTVDETTETELRQALSQLQRMDSLGAVAAGLTHNLNNVLDTIVLSVETARGKTIPAQEYDAQLNQVLSAVSKAAGMIRRLMQFGRTQDMHYRPVQVNDIVLEALQLTRPLCRDSVKVKANLGVLLPPIMADPSQVEQALVNLIVNALDAMPTGGELSITTTLNPKSEGNRPNDSVSIIVGDTGMGIPKGIQSAIFEPFFTTKPPGKGTGLGLSSVYGIVKQHNGTITVESAPGSGATFVISLPAQLEQTETTAAD